jgi:phosphoglycerol transferase MdoB-like AlkP superfamily enzyme
MKMSMIDHLLGLFQGLYRLINAGFLMNLSILIYGHHQAIHSDNFHLAISLFVYNLGYTSEYPPAGIT